MFDKLTCNENKKTQRPEFDKLNESPCLTALHVSPQTTRISFKARLGVFDTKVNFKDNYSPDLSCAICKEGRHQNTFCSVPDSQSVRQRKP